MNEKMLMYIGYMRLARDSIEKKKYNKALTILNVLMGMMLND